MNDDDVSVCLEILFDLVQEQGKKVFRYFWDSGGPGAGAGTEVIYHFRELYWPCDSDQGFLTGPFDTLKEAMKGFVVVNDATKWIECEALRIPALLKAFPVRGAKVGHVVQVNGTRCVVSAKGKLTQS